MLFQWIGDMTASDVQGIIGLMDTLAADHPLVFVIVDARRAGGFPPRARQAVSKSPHLHRVAYVVYLGASLTTRTLVTMLTGAFRLLRLFVPVFDFVNTEEEAHACVEKRRHERMATDPSSGG